MPAPPQELHGVIQSLEAAALIGAKVDVNVHRPERLTDRKSVV